MSDGHQYVERDGPGRRKDDRHKCLLHDTIDDRNLTCFAVVKADIKDLQVAMANHVSEVNAMMLAHEQAEIKNMQKYVSKWALGIFLTIAISTFGVTIGFVSNQVRETHADVKNIAQTTDTIKLNLTKFKTIQDIVVRDQRIIEEKFERKWER